MRRQEDGQRQKLSVPGSGVQQHKEEPADQIHRKNHLIAQPLQPKQAKFSAKYNHSSSIVLIYCRGNASISFCTIKLKRKKEKKFKSVSV